MIDTYKIHKIRIMVKLLQVFKLVEGLPKDNLKEKKKKKIYQRL